MSTSPPLLPVDQTLLVLEYLAGVCDVAYDDARARQALREASGADPWEELQQCGRDLGLRIQRGRWTLEELPEQILPSHPVVVLLAPDGVEGEQRWAILADRRGQQILVAGLDVEEPRWIARSELPGLLGVPEGQRIEGGVTQPATPLQQASHSGSSNDAGHGHGDGDGHGDGHGHGHGPSPFTRLLAVLRPERSDLWLVVILAVGVGVLSLAAPLAVQALVNTIVTGSDPTGRVLLLQQVIVLALILLFCLGLVAVLRTLKVAVVELIQKRVFVRVLGDLAYRLPRVRHSAFDRHHGPELVNRFFEVLTLQKAGAILLLDGLVVVLQTGIGLIVLAFYHPYLLAFDLVLIAAMIWVVFGLGRRGVRTSIEESYAKYAAASWLEEMVRHPLAFKLPGGQSFALERADQLARWYISARSAHFRIVLRQVGFSLLLQAVAAAALLGMGGWLVAKGSLTAGQLVAAELIVAALVGSFSKMGKSLESFYDLMAGVDKLGHLLDLPLEQQKGERHTASGPAAITVSRLSFHYEEGTHEDILHELSFSLAPGERVALTGPHACGKSTLAEILYGLRQPTHGRLELDGVDYRDIRLEVLREHVGLGEGREIFEGTVLDNVRVGRDHLSLRDVRKVLEDVGLLEEVQALPDGLNHRLSTGGAPLSSGQIRRLMLARVLVGKPRLLLLDEVLDDMDEDTRRHVAQAVLGPDAPWTVLLITHNPEVAALCPRRIRLGNETSR